MVCLARGGVFLPKVGVTYVDVNCVEPRMKDGMF